LLARLNEADEDPAGFVYVRDQDAMKVMNFIKFRNMTNEINKTRKYTVKALLKICA